MKEALELFYADEYWNVTQLSLNACALELLQVLAAETLQCTVYVAEDTNGVPDRLARVVRMFSPFVRDRLAENANLRQYEDSVYFSQLDIGERGVIGGIDRDPNARVYSSFTAAVISTLCGSTRRLCKRREDLQGEALECRVRGIIWQLFPW